MSFSYYSTCVPACDVLLRWQKRRKCLVTKARDLRFKRACNLGHREIALAFSEELDAAERELSALDVQIQDLKDTMYRLYVHYLDEVRDREEEGIPF